MESPSLPAKLSSVKHQSLLIAVSIVALVLGCERKDPIQTYNAPKDPPAIKVASGTSVQDNTQTPAPANSNGEPAWTVPQGWTALAAGNFTHAAYQVGSDPNLKVTVSMAGGDLKANINRWEGQLGLAPSEDLSKITKKEKVAGIDATMVDLNNNGNRMLAAIIPQGDKQWFVKFMGPAAEVAKQKDNFDAFVKSIHFDHSGHNHAAADAKPPVENTPKTNTAPANPHADPHSGISMIEGLKEYKLPEGWKVDPTPRQMRAGTIIVTAGNETADLAVSRMGANFGDMLANVNRWRGQVGLQPVQDAAAAKGQEVTLAQGPAIIFDFAGPEDQGANRKRMLVGMTQFPNSQVVWFFRLLGPHDLVAKSKPGFETFFKSIKFD